MRKRVFAVHVTTGANSYTGLPEVIFWRGYRDGTTAGHRVYEVRRHGRLAGFIERLGAVHGVTGVYDHPAYGGTLLYKAINIKSRYQ